MNDYRLTCRRVSAGTVVASMIVRGASQQAALARADAWPAAVARARGLDADDLVVRVERLAGERTLPVSVGAF